MRIRYSGPYDLEIEGSGHELRQIARALESGETESFVAEINFDPAPYSVSLAVLRLTGGAGPAQVSVRGDEVVVTGSRENLERMASFFEILQDGEHSHFEWFHGNEFIAELSVPLVVTRRDSASRPDTHV